ncbi:coiled-coil domain-containing protein 189, partial [Apteryx rowi]|uniref:coiled-coil domain-containing protein 189 n=1 Tax=Apteryx rowi TaxID=308060 RepID=UPI000E1C9937
MDLDVVAMERLQAAPTSQDRRAVLAEVLPGPPVLLHAYEGALELGRQLGLAPGPLSALLGIVRRTIAACAETPLPDREECYSYFSELLLRHAVHPTRTQTLPTSSLYSFPHAMGMLLPFSPMPAGTLYAPLPLYVPHTLPSPCLPLPMVSSLQCPPASVAVFGPSQVARVAAYVLDTVLWHAKLYAYALTPQVCLDLTLVHLG